MTGRWRRVAQWAAEAWCGGSMFVLVVAGGASVDAGRFPWGVPVALAGAMSAIVSMLVIERLSVEAEARRRSARAAGEAERAERAERAAAREAVAS